MNMKTEQNSHSSVARQLSDLLLRWQELRQLGQTPAIDELCARCPELVDELSRQIRAIESMEAILGLDGLQNPANKTGPEAAAGDLANAADFPTIPGYEFLGVLDQGGMGIVYKARQVELKRLVALKMMHTGRQAAPEQRSRFRREAEAVAQLRHPNIVQIYEVGECQEQLFFSMEFIAGGSLADRLTHGPLPSRPTAQLVHTLASAIAFAHGRGIVHRDLKPGNILLDFASPDEVSSPADQHAESANYGLPKITDFGLAKRVQHESAALRTDDHATQSGAILGTPSYMAPEQAEGNTGRIGPLVDVYALGAILYEMLTGRPPFQGETTLDTLVQVRLHEPVPPRRLQPKVPRDLETICLKCLHKEPRKRYINAEAMAEDLQRFLSGQPIRARPTQVWEKIGKWARRQPAVASLGLLSVVAVAALLAGWLLFTVQMHVEREHARQQQVLAEEQRDAARRQSARADALLHIARSSVDEYARELYSGKLEAILKEDPGRLVYRLAQYYATASGHAQEDRDLPATDRRELVQGYADQAVNLLVRARDLGFFSTPRKRLPRLDEDTHFASLRSRPDFQRLVQEIALRKSGTR
jgi:serine/threonine protein kinase